MVTCRMKFNTAVELDKGRVSRTDGASLMQGALKKPHSRHREGYALKNGGCSTRQAQTRSWYRSQR